MTWRERYASKVNADTPNGCWEWTCQRDKDGYGIITINGKKKRAHRIALEMLGVDLKDKLVMHLCDNPGCVNPEHLKAADQRENMLDMSRKGRGCNKLSNEQVKEVRDKYGSGQYTLTTLALEYGVTFQHISAIFHKIKRKAV